MPVVVKKLLEVDGALNILRAAGFCDSDASTSTEKKSTPYLSIEESAVDLPRLDTVIAALDAALLQIQTEQQRRAAAAEGPRVQCAGGCGFFGDAMTENYCSKCWRVKTGAPASASPAMNPQSKLCVRGCGFFGSDALFVLPSFVLLNLLCACQARHVFNLRQQRGHPPHTKGSSCCRQTHTCTTEVASCYHHGSCCVSFPYIQETRARE